METTTINKTSLLKGTALFYETNDKNDVRECEVIYNQKMDFPFMIWFNGKLIHSCKTFISLENRFNKLCNDWDLVPSDI